MPDSPSSIGRSPSPTRTASHATGISTETSVADQVQQAQKHVLESEHLQTLQFNAVVEAIQQPGHWNSIAGDLIPQLLGESHLLQGRALRVERCDADTGGERKTLASYQHVGIIARQPGPSPVTIRHVGQGPHNAAPNHYQATWEDDSGNLSIRDVPAEGDCLFLAVLASREKWEPLQISLEKTKALREDVAQYLKRNRDRYAGTIELAFQAADIAAARDTGAHPVRIRADIDQAVNETETKLAQLNVPSGGRLPRHRRKLPGDGGEHNLKQRRGD